MQTSKTDKFIYLFSYFLLFTMAVDVDGLGPDFIIASMEEIQNQCVILHQTFFLHLTLKYFRLWLQVLGTVVIPEVPKMPQRDRKVVAVGLTRMLTQSTLMLQEPNTQAWYVLIDPFFSPAEN
jgi:exportin-2 (importin alpha re-exporter)